MVTDTLNKDPSSAQQPQEAPSLAEIVEAKRAQIQQQTPGIAEWKYQEVCRCSDGQTCEVCREVW
jgi:hypothetical protein